MALFYSKCVTYQKLHYKSISNVYHSNIKKINLKREQSIAANFHKKKTKKKEQSYTYSVQMDYFISNNITVKQQIQQQINYTFIQNNGDNESLHQSSSNCSSNQDLLTELYNLVMQYKCAGYKKIRQRGEEENEEYFQMKEQAKANYKQCTFRPIHEDLTVERCLESSRMFALAGGYIIYLQDQEGQLDRNTINQVQQFAFSKEYKDGSILIAQQWNEVISDYNSIVNILLSTQNQNDYIIANCLQRLYSGISGIKQQIDQVINTYDQTQLQILIEARRNYMQQYVQNYKQNNLSSDEFFMIIPFNLNFEKKTMLIYDFQMSKALISLIGSSSDLFINYIMRKTIISIYPQQTRLKFYLNSLNDFSPSRIQRQQVVEIPNFEVYTIEHILMNTTCVVTTIQVDYPPDLQFKGEGLEKLNHSECVSIMNIQISHEELKKVITTRQAYINSMVNNNSDYFWCNLDDFIVDNFEHYMQNLIFLEKFYKEDIQ